MVLEQKVVHSPKAALRTGSLSQEVRAHGRKRRVAQLRELLGPRTAHLEKKDGEAMQAVFSTPVRAETWLDLTERCGIDSPRAGRAIAWAVRALLDKLERDAKRGVKTLASDDWTETAEKLRGTARRER